MKVTRHYCDICRGELEPNMVGGRFCYEVKVPYVGHLVGRNVPWDEAQMELCDECRSKVIRMFRRETGEFEIIPYDMSDFCYNGCMYSSEESCAHCPVRLTLERRGES